MHIKVISVTKVYFYNLLDLLLDLGKAYFRVGKKPLKIQHSIRAIDDVSFEIHEEERVGIIGKNGAGKSTLLRMIAGLAKQSSGKIEVVGSVNCIMTLGVGLKEEISGRENIVLNAELNGLPIGEITSILDDIIQFADIGSFIDQPVRTYSSGMKARLSFSMIIFTSPEILIIDEALSVGDSQFSIKSSVKMKEICSRGKIIILVSHSMNAITSICNRCIWIDEGRIIRDGDPVTVTGDYMDDIRKKTEITLQDKFKTKIQNKSYSRGATINGPFFIDLAGKSRLIILTGENVDLCMEVTIPFKYKNFFIKISLLRIDGIEVLSDIFFEENPIHSPGTNRYRIPFYPVLLGKGIYEIHINVTTPFDSSESPNDGELLAISRTIFYVENRVYPYENPIYWHCGYWNYEPSEGE